MNIDIVQTMYFTCFNKFNYADEQERVHSSVVEQLTADQ